MADPEGVLVAVNAAAASVLCVSGAAKVVSPDHLRRSLGEVLPRREVTPAQVRGLAVAEVAVGLLLTIAATRTAAAWGVGALGAAFALAGAVGWRRKTSVACGCFGSSAGRPLGPANVLIGGSLAAVPLVNLAIGVTGGSADYFHLMSMATALGMLLLCLWVHRGLVRELTRPMQA